MSAVQLRQRRKTAGKRINSLIGKALQDDHTFWNHDTWEEQDSDNDTGNESFRDSDQDSSLKQDAFDSDFNDSETDDDEQRNEAGRQAEAILAQQDKIDKRKHKLHHTHISKDIGIARTRRSTQHKRKHKTKPQRIVGDGHNAGLVLNFPQQLLLPANNNNNNILPTATTSTGTGAGTATGTGTSIGIPTTATTTTNKPTTNNKRHNKQHTTTKRSLRPTTQEKSAESNKQATTTTATAQAKSQATKRNTLTTTRKQKTKRFTQEQLLLEAANVTEPLNERWLLQRKRLHEQAEATQKAAAATAAHNQTGAKILHRYVSRRGYLNTITFAEMDAVPAVLTHSDRPLQPTTPVFCAITAKRARYKCPKTGEGYYDLAAFRELRRRWSNGLPLRSDGDSTDCVDDKGQNDTPVVVAMESEPPSPPIAALSETPPAVLCSSLEVPALAGECVGSEESSKNCVETTSGTSPSDGVSEIKSSNVPDDSVPSPPEEAVESGTSGTVVAAVLPAKPEPLLSSSTPASGGVHDEGGTSETPVAPIVSESTTVSVMVEATDGSCDHSS